ncbi:MAG TPA: hypothetical protein VD994_13155, partial [Prosthecobacter sp.]|nr:hypothetical protein [Prosthecobacter sp.]
MKLVLPLLAAMLCSWPLHGTEPQGAKPPPRKELWVPTESLERILENHPNAVMLTPEQYEALVRDAGKLKPEEDPHANPAPKEIFVEGLRLRGKVEPGASSVVLTGELTLYVPAEGWAQTRVAWPWPYPMLNAGADGPVLAARSADIGTGQASKAVAPPRVDGPAGTPEMAGLSAGSPPMAVQTSFLELAVKGPGRRTLKFETMVSLQRWNGEGLLGVPHVPVAGWLELELPQGAVVTESSPYEKAGEIYKVAFDHRFPAARRWATNINPPKDSCQIRWMLPAGDTTAPQVQIQPHSTSVRYEVSESEVRAVISFHVDVLRAREADAVWTLSGGGAQVVDVRGPDVKGWRQEGDQITVTLSHSAGTSPTEVHLRMARDESAIELPLPSLDLGTPVKAQLDITVSEGLELLAVTGAVEADQQRFFSLGRDSITIRAQTSRPRLEADVDALVKLERDSVNLQRTITLRTDRPQREVRLTMPVAEEFTGVASPVSGFEWKRVGRVLELRFTQLLQPGAPATVTLNSRQKLAKAWNGPRIAEAVTLEN